MHSDPIDVLFAFDRFAHASLLDRCAELDENALHRSFEMGLGSVHDTLRHMHGAIRGWTDVLEERGGDQTRDERRCTIDEFRAAYDGAIASLERAVRSVPIGGTLHPERGGKRYTFTRGGIAMHVLTHQVHHRAQCCNMLRQLGVEPQPESSVLQWMMADTPPS